MGYSSCKADPDLWLKAVTRPDDNVRYYAYILCYVNNILIRADNPFPVNYCSDTDLTDHLDEHLIGVMRWMVELGRIDIATKVSMLSSYLAYPREGHLEAALHIMGYLRLKHNSRLIFDPAYPDIDQTAFPVYDWMEFYGDVEEAIPPDMPPPLGKEIDLCMMVDSDHVGNKMTQCSCSGFLIFCNLSPIIWIPKKQATIETSIFGAEFVTMKHGIETLRGLCCKPSDQPRDAAQREECSGLDEKSLTTFCRCDERAKGIAREHQNGF